MRQKVCSAPLPLLIYVNNNKSTITIQPHSLHTFCHEEENLNEIKSKLNNKLSK